jgi:hypothetical protein
LAQVVQRAVADYVCEGINATMYYVENTSDENNQVYLTVSVRNPKPSVPEDRPETTVVIMARVVNHETVIIESDKTDRPLYEELMRAGIPREQIVLRYMREGER